MADASLKALPTVTERFIAMQHKLDIGRYVMRVIHDENCEPLHLRLKIAGRGGHTMSASTPARSSTFTSNSASSPLPPPRLLQQ
ncbi:hypothetical protein [Burkholderia sp. Bp9140]|uniref:hypothetical protein n=1 Tax=Burkholderia sp. Bp9140 TaxID=2184572 RepID=UPI000F5718E9|nr:hypothetical protein [Burkholderia sp. Bp9140]